MDFTRDEITLLRQLVIGYLTDIKPHDDAEAEVILNKLNIMKSTINISNDDYSK